ncbi:MAG: carboxypeptidase-like regulatory domain-containing protein, partial [bacterium]
MPDPTTQPRIQIITSAELLDLAENLRRIGFVLDTGQYLRAHKAGDILLALDLEGRLDSVERLRTTLAPIFCGTPDEQETFYAFFDEWLAKNPQIIERIGLSRKDEQPFAHEPSVVVKQDQKKYKRRKWWPWIIAGGVTIALCFVLFVILQNQQVTVEQKPTQVELSGQVVDAVANLPVNGVDVVFLGDSTKTDSLGVFRFPRVPVDTRAQLIVKHPGYLNKSAGVLTTHGRDSLVIQIWKNLGPQKLTTRVLEANTRTPLQAANITFLNETKPTDQNGRVEFTYQPEDRTAEVASELDGFLPGSKSIPIHGHGPADIEIAMQPEPPAEVDSLHALVGRINAYADSVTARPPLTELERFYQDNFANIRLAGMALPFALFVIWWFSRWLRRRLLLERQTTTVTPKTGAVVVKGVADYLFRNSIFRRMVQQFRQHREVGSTDLNAPATVDATLRCGGLFTPVFATRFLSPEYLILIDRASFGDQHAGFIDALVKRMVSDGVIVDRYYFDRDPRVCQPEKLGEPHLTIQELFVRHPKHRLLIFSDAAGFFDTITGKPHHWLDDFLEWSSSAIFIPERTDAADYLEFALKDFGLSVGPATAAGLSQHLEALAMQGAMGKVQWDRDKPFPDMLEEHSDLWLDRQPPPEQRIDNLIATLRDFLESDSFYWLCACAVYPELHWELTLYLATNLKMGDAHPVGYGSDGAHTLTGEQQVFVQKCLTDLTRLPWFRQGYMPDWLRRRLIAEMDRRQHIAVRRILDSLLKEAGRPKEDAPPGGFTLPFAHKSLATLKAAVLGKLGILSDESPLDDYVFANYMSGSKPGKLAVFVPEAVKKLFFRDGQTVLGMRPFMAFLLAGIFCSLNWLGLTAMQPKPHIPPPIPKFAVQEDYDLPGIEGPVAQSDSSLAYYMNGYFQYKRIDLRTTGEDTSISSQILADSKKAANYSGVPFELDTL